MDERVTKCLDTIGEAFKTLVTSADNELEVLGLVAVALHELPKTYENAMEEGFNELEKRKKEGN